jgi:hypothetical protein
VREPQQLRAGVDAWIESDLQRVLLEVRRALFARAACGAARPRYAAPPGAFASSRAAPRAFGRGKVAATMTATPMTLGPAAVRAAENIRTSTWHGVSVSDGR